MKINFILPGVGASGGIKIAFMYAQYLTEQGHDVICYYPLSGAYVGWKKILFPKMVLLQLTKEKYKANWFEHSFEIKHPLFINNISVRNADVTIATLWLTAYWVNRLSAKKGKKCYFVQGYETWGDEKYNNKVKASYDLVFDERIVVSSELWNKLHKHHQVFSKVICNGIVRKEARLEKKGNSSSMLVIGFPYRPNAHKNCVMAIEVLKEIEETHKVIIKSYGFSKPENWNESWEFLENPTRTELVSFYESVDIFYVPSTYEGWGLPAMEAMAQGCAVIAHNSGVIAEIGIDNENCIVLEDATDKEEVKNKLVELVQNREKIAKIGEAARSEIVTNYLHENSCAKFEQCMQNLCNQKIAILSLYYKNANYGGILQSFALQHVLDNLGFDAKQISYEMFSGYANIPKWKRKLFFARTFYSFIRRPIWTISNYKLMSVIKKFADRVPHTQKVTAETIGKLNKSYDVFICGSDQIWNPIGWQPTFFLDFVENGKVKISYAASIARDMLSDKEIDYIKEYTADFTALSVREEKSAELLRKKGVAVEVMPDPTLLLEREEWENVTSERLIKEDYIFAYFLGVDIHHRENAIAYANAHKKKIVFIPFMQYATFQWDKAHKDYTIEKIGVPEFLSLIKYADAVITDSFHGTVFSIIYERPFYNLDRYINGDVNSMNSRLETLLEGIKVNDRRGNTLPDEIREFTEQEINNIQIYKREKRMAGLSFLEMVLKEKEKC